MHGLMMDAPLNIASLLVHAERWHGDTEIVSRRVEGGLHTSSWGTVARRARQLAQALIALGAKEDDRIATLAWNTDRHLELYYAISGIGAVCHTINPRLFPEQIDYIVRHAEDRWLFVDLTFVPLVAKLPVFKQLRGIVVMTDRAHMPDALPDALCYEELLDAQDGDYAWPVLDERQASSLCYTSGTTGEPKGVLYSHRSSVLHAFAVCMPDGLGIAARDTMCPVVPMFHVNAWGIPHAAALVGCRLALPGPCLDGASLYDFFERTRTTISAGVPTLWFGLLAHVHQQALTFSSLRGIVIGGSAAPPSMIRAFEQQHGVRVVHAWGMTETSPVGTVGAFKAHHADWGFEQRLALQCTQGRPVFGVDVRIVDDAGATLPHDGRSAGELEVRGYWVTSGYFGRDDEALLHDGWFRTGDVAAIDADGYVQITDRAKDIIKSGGEWISSVELENVAVGHPGVAEAAAIGVHHPKWEERPLLVVVRKPGADVTREEMLAFFEGKVAKWWIPDDVAFVEQLPHTATGKLSKLQLRKQFEGRLPLV